VAGGKRVSAFARGIGIKGISVHVGPESRRGGGLKGDPRSGIGVIPAREKIEDQECGVLQSNA